MDSQHHFLSVLIVVLSLSLSFTEAKPVCQFPAIFNFGDSNSDTGGLSAVYGQLRSPNGDTFFHTPTGRYCDGRLVIDFIAERLGLRYLSPYLDSIGSNFTNGANFATAGSTIIHQNTTFFQSGYSPIPLDIQFNEFYDFHTRSQSTRRKDGYFSRILPKEEAFARALYTFDIGQNDLTSGYFSHRTTSEVKASIPDLLIQFKNVVKEVYGQGGRYFWIHNTGPLGCLPYVLQRLPVKITEMDRAGCAIPHNEVAQVYNRGLREVVIQLRKELPLAAITYVDVYSARYNLISQPKKYGFTQTLSACCGNGKNKYNYDVRFGCGYLVRKACDNPRASVNWDGYHYTEAANKLVFDQIVQGTFSDPPIPLQFACYRN